LGLAVAGNLQQGRGHGAAFGLNKATGPGGTWRPLSISAEMAWLSAMRENDTPAGSVKVESASLNASRAQRNRPHS